MLRRLFSPFVRLPHHTVSLLIVGVLVFLRVPFLAGVATFWEQAQNVALVIFFPVTYLVTAFLIWWERDRLRAFRIDLVTGMIFLCQMYMFPVGILLFRKMHKSKARFPAPPSNLLRWMLVGGLLAVLAEMFAMQMGLKPDTVRTGQPASLGSLFVVMIIQMLNAAVFEEPLFRGFLWGHLRMIGWKNVWIWLFQALLFTFAHAYYLKTQAFPLFFARMMIPALLMGLIAWQARSTAASMVTHGFHNAVGNMFSYAATLEGAYQAAWTAVGILVVLLIVQQGWEMHQRRW